MPEYHNIVFEINLSNAECRPMQTGTQVTRAVCERLLAVANLCGFVCTRTCGFFVTWAVNLCKKWHWGLNVCKIPSNPNPTYVFFNGYLFYNITAIHHISNLSKKFPGFRWFSGFSRFLETRKPQNLETCKYNNRLAKIFNLPSNNDNNVTSNFKWGIKRE